MVGNDVLEEVEPEQREAGSALVPFAGCRWRARSRRPRCDRSLRTGGDRCRPDKGREPSRWRRAPGRESRYARERRKVAVRFVTVANQFGESSGILIFPSRLSTCTRKSNLLQVPQILLANPLDKVRGGAKPACLAAFQAIVRCTASAVRQRISAFSESRDLERNLPSVCQEGRQESLSESDSGRRLLRRTSVSRTAMHGCGVLQDTGHRERPTTPAFSHGVSQFVGVHEFPRLLRCFAQSSSKTTSCGSSTLWKRRNPVSPARLRSAEVGIE